MKISIVGVGKVGRVFGEVMSEHHDVCGYDVTDPGPVCFDMAETLQECVKDSTYIFVVGPTPHPEEFEGAAPCSHLDAVDFDYSVLIEIFGNLEKVTTTRQTIVLISTVSPGTIRYKLKPLISNPIIYSPALIAQGTIAHDLKNPEMVIMGSETADESQLYDYSQMYSRILDKTNVYYAKGTWEECESIKMMYNTFLVMKYTFANTIIDISEKIGNIDTDVVTTALGKCTNRLFSGKQFSAGMVPGGVCLPRDSVALSSTLNSEKIKGNLFESLIVLREDQAKAMADRLLDYERPVIIIGKSYKPGVPIAQGSSSLLVAHYLKYKTDYYFYDPLMDEYPPKLSYDAVYLLAHMTHDSTYGFDFPEGSIILDPWRRCPDIEGCIVIHIGDTRE